MATKNVEIQDDQGNIYYPHTDADVVKFGDSTVGASLSERANKGTPTEYDLALSSGYTSVAAKYSKDEFNRVLLTLHDLKKTDGSVLTGGIIGQLPDGFIPSRYFFTSSLSFVDSGGTIQVVTANLLVGINGSIGITIKNPSNYSITKCHGQIIFQV